MDIVMNGFWGGRSEHCFVDVQVFNPYAQSNVHSISASYKHYEDTKRRAYGQRVWEIEHVSFTPIATLTTEGLGNHFLQKACFSLGFQIAGAMITV